MVLTMWIEWCLAIQAGVASTQVLRNGNFTTTVTAQNGLASKFRFAPPGSFMICTFLVAIITGIIFIATFEPDGNDIERRLIVNAAGGFVH